tara:strand:+ start:994 stop:1155 length:162 start_codon:yes stop_codon:yes gene_type:complete
MARYKAVSIGQFKPRRIKGNFIIDYTNVPSGTRSTDLSAKLSSNQLMPKTHTS